MIRLQNIKWQGQRGKFLAHFGGQAVNEQRQFGAAFTPGLLDKRNGVVDAWLKWANREIGGGGIAGHHGVDHRNAQTFAFTYNAGEIHAITDDLLAELLGQADLDLAFLNGCSSYALARKAIAKNVRFVICWKTRVADTAASAF